jgi:MFS family permease
LRLLLAAAAAFGVVEVVAGLMPTYATFAVALVPVGVTSLTFITSANSLMQLSVDPVMRGRVMALYMAVFMGGTPIGAPLVGALAAVFGARWSLLAGGLVSTTAAVACAVVLSRRSGIELRDGFRGLGRQRAPEDVPVEAVR